MDEHGVRSCLTVFIDEADNEGDTHKNRTVETLESLKSLTQSSDDVPNARLRSSSKMEGIHLT